MILYKSRNIITLGILGLVVIMGGCSGKKDPNAANTVQIVTVKGEQVTLVSRELTKNFTGTLEGDKQAVIRAKIAEAVEKIHVREGDFVAANSPIVSLNRTGPTSSFIQMSSVYQNAEKNFNKMKYLFEQGAVSESQFDGARTEYEVAKANYDAAAQMVDLTSPIAGTVTSIDVSQGQYVSPGQQIATVATIDRIRMKLGVSGSDISYFHGGQKVNISVQADSILLGEGQVSTVARSADPATRAFQVEIEINNQTHLFKPGMFGKAEIAVGTYDNIVIAPRPAIIARNEKYIVFTVSGDKAVAREVVLGIEFDGIVQVKEGLNPGDTLITIGQNYLKDGTSIRMSRFVDANGKEVEL